MEEDRITQRYLAAIMNCGTQHVRELCHSLRSKGYGVIGDGYGMYRTDDRILKDRQAESLVRRAASILAAAQGLVRKDQDEMTPEERLLWELLPLIERAPDAGTSETLNQFEPIDLASLLY